MTCKTPWKPQRYFIVYGSIQGSSSDYVLWDDEANLIVAEGNDKTALIRQAQTLNGFVPVDGKEFTWRMQIIAHEASKDRKEEE